MPKLCWNEPQASESPVISASDKTLFTTAYFAAQRGFANDSVNRIFELQRFNGTECNYVDLHSTTIADVQCSLAAVLDGQLEGKRSGSNFFGVLVDKSTDISVYKTLIMYSVVALLQQILSGMFACLVARLRRWLQSLKLRR